MPWYNDLRPINDENKVNYALIFPQLQNTERIRIIENLLKLRGSLEDIPAKRNDTSVLLATWNLKEFGKSKERLPESYFYIAEIINRFDLVAIQEIKSTLDDLKIIMKLLGSNWGYQITDITEGRSGNKERFGYIYDKRKIQPSGLSGEMVLWDEITENSNIKQLKRTPAITGFRAGWKQFAILNVHLHPGDDDDDREYRKEEVRLLLKAIDEKKRLGHFWSENLILLGDTNLYRVDTDTLDMIHDAGFRECTGLDDKNTNVSDTEIYDRVFLSTNEYFKLIKTSAGIENGDVFKVFETVYTDNEVSNYHDYMLLHKDDPSSLKKPDDFKSYFHRYWKRNQLSDHNPVWLEIEIDSSNDFLTEKKEMLENLVSNLN